MPHDLSDIPDEFDKEALARSHDVMVSIVGGTASVRLVITPDFEQAVRDAVDDPIYAEMYKKDRGAFGAAAAKTIPKSDGTVDVVIDNRLLLKGAPEDPEGTFRHEAYHVLMHGRGESLFDFGPRERKELRIHALYLGMAGIAAEEFRVEATEATGIRESQHGAFPALLRAFEQRLVAVSDEYQRTLDVDKICREVKDSFHSVVTACGYVAAAMEAGGLPLPSVPAEIDNAVFGAPGRKVIELLRTFPTAAETTPVAELEDKAREVAVAVEEWIRWIGFVWEDEGDQLAFYLLKPAAWAARGLRSAA